VPGGHTAIPHRVMGLMMASYKSHESRFLHDKEPDEVRAGRIGSI